MRAYYLVAPVLSNYPTSGDGSWKCWRPEGHGNDITHTGTGMGKWTNDDTPSDGWIDAGFDASGSPGATFS